jgi:hypothetical protein
VHYCWIFLITYHTGRRSPISLCCSKLEISGATYNSAVRREGHASRAVWSDTPKANWHNIVRVLRFHPERSASGVNSNIQKTKETWCAQADGWVAAAVPNTRTDHTELGCVLETAGRQQTMMVPAGVTVVGHQRALAVVAGRTVQMEARQRGFAGNSGSGSHMRRTI